MSLLEGQQLPLFPENIENPSLVKWIRDLNDYLRRLDGKLTAANILNLFVQEGDVNNFWTTINENNGLDEKVALASGETENYLESLLNNLQTSTYTANRDHEIDVERVSDKLTFFIDASSISGYTEGNQQVLTHSASGDLAWVDTDTC